MNNIEYVDKRIAEMKAGGIPLSDVAWEAAKACNGWPYVFGAVGEKCEPKKRSQYGTKFYLKKHETIVTACQALSWNSREEKAEITGNCNGCKWNLPVEMFDCRGFTRKILQWVYGWTLQGSGCTKQWNNADNWTAKGPIETVPEDQLVCLFQMKGSTAEHTGFGYRGETVECQKGVQYKKAREGKWTHWGLPKCVSGDVPEPDPDVRPTLRKGDSGTYVTLMQEMLIQRGYSCGSYGADGKFGNATLAALKAFQKDNGLTADGVCGKNTWAALQGTELTIYYTVTIPHVTGKQAEALCAEWSGATRTKE